MNSKFELSSSVEAVTTAATAVVTASTDEWYNFQNGIIFDCRSNYLQIDRNK